MRARENFAAACQDLDAARWHLTTQRRIAQRVFPYAYQNADREAYTQLACKAVRRGIDRLEATKQCGLKNWTRSATASPFTATHDDAATTQQQEQD